MLLALSPMPLSEIYFIIEMIIKMIFQHMIRSDSLYFYAKLILQIPSSEDRNETFLKIGCNKRMNVKNYFSGFYFINYE